MNRTIRRSMRKEAMQNTLERINTAMRKIDFTDPNSKATFSNSFATRTISHSRLPKPAILSTR